MKKLLLALLLLWPVSVVADAPQIVSLNPQPKKPVDPPTPEPTPKIVADGSYKLSAGKIQVLKLQGWDKPVTWNVIHPRDAKGTFVTVTKYRAMPKGSPIFGFMEGAEEADAHVFDAETLVLVATGKGSGFVTVQALAVEGTSVKIVAEMLVDVGGKKPDPDPIVPPDPAKPDGKLGLRKASREGAARAPPSVRPVESQSLAYKQRSLAAAIQAGAVNTGGQFDPALALVKWREGNNASVADKNAWAAWAAACSAKLEALFKAGSLPDKSAWADAFIEIAEGLEDMK